MTICHCIQSIWSTRRHEINRNKTTIRYHQPQLKPHRLRPTRRVWLIASNVAVTTVGSTKRNRSERVRLSVQMLSVSIIVIWQTNPNQEHLIICHWLRMDSKQIINRMAVTVEAAANRPPQWIYHRWISKRAHREQILPAAIPMPMTVTNTNIHSIITISISEAKPHRVQLRVHSNKMT